ncbi:APC family permease [Methanofollis ethanolicus]|uniref:APC family permease n=1 Tax=Methanofollis ethanolicus TaxID=488124 RepID=UPI000833A64B|nr:APC family permease [Methanofollis ethanolicus]
MDDGYTRSGRLSAGTAVALAVGNMVGAGVFVLSGLMIQTAGPSAILSYLCGILVAFTGLSYAVLASICPGDGGGYLYAHRMLGPYPGFLAGWGMYISVTIASAFVLLGLGIYANRLLGTAFDPRTAALAGLALLTVLNLRSTAEAGRAEVALVAVKIAILTLVAAVGATYLTPADLTPFFPHGTGTMFDGVAMVFFAYLGFQVATMMGGEIRSSARVFPLATLASIGIVAVIYCGVEVALLAAHLPEYGDSSLFDAAVVFFGGWGETIIALGAIFSTLSAANANIIGGSRAILTMAAEKQIAGLFAALRGEKPANAVLLRQASRQD